MSHRNKFSVIFDGDNDMLAYANMKGWNESEHIEFDCRNRRYNTTSPDKACHTRMDRKDRTS